MRSAQRLFWVGVVLAGALPPLVFTNLYLVHDYYLAAVTPALAALLGLAAGFIWRLLPSKLPVRVLAAVAGLLLAASTVGLDYAYWRHAWIDDPDPATLALARQLDRVSGPDDRIGVLGLDWSPAVLYYADRWGLMVVDQREQEALDSLRRDRYRHLLVRQPEETDLRTLSRWPWIASLSANVYGVAESLDELPASPLLATDSADGIASGRTLRRGLHVPCDGRPTTIPSGPDGTLVRVSNDGSTTRVWASDELAPLPGRRAILLAQELATGGTVALHCSGPPLVVDVNEAVFPARA